ncbi:O-antigen ligase family protein [Marinimicrococcus flavescens]|uniref:O-antigen ligase family protein n=1 Tax=Marinimicrococcus flavescens TaxID=3031815 RepID=A0AAP3UZE3_9PROT|nr:O-antigen ligase family protein [Marinimicrococcus flavescens]
MRVAALRLPSRSRLLDLCLAVHTVVFLGLFVTDAVLSLRPYVPLFAKPVELFALMLLPIILRVHVPDFRHHRLAFSLAMWRDNAHVLVPFAILIVLAFMTGILPGADLGYGEGKALFILIYRFLMLAGGLTAAILLLRIGWRPVVLLLLLFLLGSVFYDIAWPGTLSQMASRAGGFQQNPNLAAIAIVMLTAMAVRYDRMYPLDLAVILLSFIATFSTLSRGGLLQFAVFLANYVWLTGRGRRVEQLVVAPVVAALMIGIGALSISTMTTSSTMFDDENAQRRLATFSLGNETVYETDDVRLGLIPKYLKLIDESIIFGQGTGFSRSQPFGPHNTYLEVWVNNGFLALAAYLWLLGALLYMAWARRFWQGFVFAQIALVAGFFTHNVIQLPVFLLSAGLALGLSWGLAVERTLRHRRRAAAAANRAAPPAAPS